MVLGLQRRQRLAHALAGVDAAAQERAFQRVLAMHATTAEAGGLAAGVEPLEHGAVGVEAAAGKVGFDAAQRLAGEDFQAHGDERALGFVEQPVRWGGAHNLIAQECARDADVVDLRVFAKRVVQLRVAALDKRA